MIDVLMLGPYPSNEEVPVGGMEALVQVLAQELARLGDWRIHVVSLADRGPWGAAPQDNLSVTWVRRSKHLSTITGNWFEVRRLRNACANKRPALVHAFGTREYATAAFSLGLPLLMAVGGIEAREATQWRGLRGTLRRRVVTAIERRSFQRCKHVVAQSRYVEQHIRPLTEAEVFSIDVLVDERYFAAASTADEGPRILFVGVCTPRKGIHHLVEAMRCVVQACPRATLLTVGPTGDERYEAALRAKAADLGLASCVRFAGALPRAALIREYSRCSVVVLPSYEESAGIALAQAMAARKPVVATRRGGIPDIVQDGQTGLLVEFGDVAALSEALISLLTNEPKRQAFGTRAREIAVKRFLPSIVAAHTAEAYRVVLRSQR